MRASNKRVLYNFQLTFCQHPTTRDLSLETLVRGRLPVGREALPGVCWSRQEAFLGSVFLKSAGTEKASGLALLVDTETN